jgi:hypothetical protein
MSGYLVERQLLPAAQQAAAAQLTAGSAGARAQMGE